MFLYLFDGVFHAEEPLSVHGLDINYIFFSWYTPPPLEEDLRMAVTMASFWQNFAAHGDPNVHHDLPTHERLPHDRTELPPWPRYEANDGRQSIVIERINQSKAPRYPIVGGDDYSQGQCAFWDAVIPAVAERCHWPYTNGSAVNGPEFTNRSVREAVPLGNTRAGEG